jgi:hypothetical protein
MEITTHGHRWEIMGIYGTIPRMCSIWFYGLTLCSNVVYIWYFEHNEDIMKNKETTTITIRLPNDVLEILDERCSQLGWMRSQLIRAYLLDAAKTLKDTQVITFGK